MIVLLTVGTFKWPTFFSIAIGRQY